MARFLKRRNKAKGAAPGSYIFIGNREMDSTRIRLFKYNQDECIENEYSNIDEALTNISYEHLNWLNIDGIHDTSLFPVISEKFEISALAFENILNTGQRAKVFEDKNSITVITKAVDFNTVNNTISVDQISFILSDHVLISFQETTGNYFIPVRERIRKSVGVVRKSSPDYLLFALIDSLVDHNLLSLEKLGEKIEMLEERIPELNEEVGTKLFLYKREITYFRKSIHPLKEVIARIVRHESNLINDANLVYYRELNDLIDLSNESLEIYFNLINDYINQFNTLMGHKDNQVMKVLTIFAAIFIPLTFIAGIYGTNFDYIPELHFKSSYFTMLGVMATLAIGMLVYFKRNKWF